MNMRQNIAILVYLSLSAGAISLLLGLVRYLGQSTTDTPHLAYLGAIFFGLGLFALLWLYQITQQES